ncbi:sodium:solute symporter [Arachidicoccus ginsenosidimutans]|uniref:sodium:solute symporter family protein n=1 Tax=Arachidicoccus sp. BS20 TaxID=1850526 RepID=UPI0007F0C7B5|nr:sodium:solute symporter family protein [Arachidicoccus sp. BS20]ANI90264.1 sodium:solute symporter [Arachidicoccus sp. BS20]
MKLQLIDIIIILAYLLSMLVIGWTLRKRARLNKENYLLGGKSLPWYMLGLSNAGDMFDISGTMWLVSLCFVYGMKSIWIPWLWPVFNQVFMMMYLSKWLRRSNATTGAEWLETRFGKEGTGVRASHNIVVVFALLSCLGFMAYGFVGLGKFVEIFVPWKYVAPYVPFHVSAEYVPHFYGVVFTLFAMFYAVIGGMHSIVLGDVIKYAIMTIACVSVGVIAMIHLKGQQVNVPKGWINPFFGWRLNLDWTGITADANKKIQSDDYSLFGLFFMMMLFKGVFASLAGPAPNYDMQKILSTRSPEEASKMSGFVSIILMPVRYTLVIGLTVLGLLYFNQIHPQIQGTNGTDFETILPATINTFLPAGLMGLVLTGLFGAFMGTFSGTLNAAQAYIVNDIYLKYINPEASNKKIISMNYIAGVGVVIIGIGLGCFIKDVNTILQWIVSGLYGGYIASNMLKWHWWRFNARGFFWGMLAGIVPAIALAVLKSLNILKGLDLYYWIVIFILSLTGSILGSYTAPPTDEAVLKSFYKTIRPWGFWKPVHQKVVEEDAMFAGNKNFKLNMFNVVLGIIGQLCLTILPMYVVLQMKLPLLITITILLVVLFILKKTWWNRLNEY